MSLETSMKPAFGDNEGFRGERIPDPVLAVPIQTQMTFFLQNTKFDNLMNVQLDGFITVEGYCGSH